MFHYAFLQCRYIVLISCNECEHKHKTTKVTVQAEISSEGTSRSSDKFEIT